MTGFVTNAVDLAFAAESIGLQSCKEHADDGMGIDGENATKDEVEKTATDYAEKENEREPRADSTVEREEDKDVEKNPIDQDQGLENIVATNKETDKEDVESNKVGMEKDPVSTLSAAIPNIGADPNTGVVESDNSTAFGNDADADIADVDDDDSTAPGKERW